MDVSIKVLRVKIIPIVVCATLCFISACSEPKQEPIPVGIIAQDTMVQMLTEIHLLESSLSVRIADESSLKNTRNAIKSKIYSNYGVSKEQFYKSYKYYAEKPVLIDSIYINVISEISKRQVEQTKKQD
jgi:hypothetical protein